MNQFEFATYARNVLDSHGLWYWEFKWDGGKRRAGLCDQGNNTISMSRHLFALRSFEDSNNTLLHEIAHAIVGCEHGHNMVWQKKAAEIGCDARRTFKSKPEERVKGNWRPYCPTGDHFAGPQRFRRPKGYKERTWICTSCKKIGAVRPVIEWKAI